MSKMNLLHLSENKLTEELKSLGQPKFRVKQILEWLYKHQVCSIEEMTNLSKDLRKSFSEKFQINHLIIDCSETSEDGTRKYVFVADDGVKFETVGIPSFKNEEKSCTSRENDGLTVCVSSQAGCKMGCSFCATGRQKFYRDLYVGEIVEQVLLVQNDFNQRVSNVVVMGQGEPFLNYENVIEALKILNDSNLVGIGARKITVSTCGILDGIIKFSNEQYQFGLAISLHSCIQSIRDKLMPGVRNFDLSKLKDVLIKYQQKTNRRITFEYLLIKNINDSNESLNSLINFCSELKCHVNLLSYNPVEKCAFESSDKTTILKWEESLDEKGINTTYRKSRGQDISGACGQLINKE